MFWDFISLRPETTHQVCFLFSDRGIPDGYQHMNGYGSHTFKMVNDKGEAVYCKFHLKVLYKAICSMHAKYNLGCNRLVQYFNCPLMCQKNIRSNSTRPFDVSNVIVNIKSSLNIQNKVYSSAHPGLAKKPFH